MELYLKEKFGLKNVMMGLINILKLSMIFGSSTCTGIMQEKMLTLSGPAKRKGLGWSLIILLQLLHNRMTVLNGTSLPYSTGCVPCSMARNLLLSWELAYRPKPQTPPLFLKFFCHYLSLFQHFFGKGKRSILSLVQKFGEMCITMSHNNYH